MRLLLSVDGGGIRGILPGRLLQAMQEASCFPKFDMVSGTSTGGILACGISAGIPAAKLVDLYVNKGGQVFDGRPLAGLFEPKYYASNLEALLAEILGAKLLSEASPELLVPSYCVDMPAPADPDGGGVPKRAAAWFFKSWEARAGKQIDLLLSQVARATSAAPTYFPTAGLGQHWMVDGGVFANNPALCALADAHELWPGEAYKVLSIGTGSKVKPLDGPDSAGWGLAQWGPEMPDLFMDGAADSVTYQLKRFTAGNFLRCQIALEGVDSSFDDASDSNIAALSRLADTFVKQELPRVKAFLVGNTSP